MKAPHEKGVIQIITTNRCDLLTCSNCTQMMTHQKSRFYMPPDLFREAVRSLQGYTGVIGVFGGNPCVHPQFDELARIMREEVPNRKQRGLWSNNINGHGKVIRETFGYFNFNVHGNPVHAEEIEREVMAYLKPDIDAVRATMQVWGFDPHVRQSHHSPVLTAVKDVVKDEAEMWRLIEDCDINKHWSGAITMRGDNLRCYFCEVAAAFDNVYREDNGLPVTNGWWRQPIEAYANQIKRWCPNCGVPLKMSGHRDNEKTDDYSLTHAELFVKGKRLNQLHTSRDQAKTKEVTDYMRLRGEK